MACSGGRHIQMLQSSSLPMVYLRELTINIHGYMALYPVSEAQKYQSDENPKMFVSKSKVL